MSTELRGRPRIRQDEEILEAALASFAVHGFDAMSVRALNTALGLAHGTVNQRFRSKDLLFEAAIDHAFSTFLAEVATERDRRGPVDGDLAELRELVRAFLISAARRPELGRLMNQEGLRASAQLTYIVDTVLTPAFTPVIDTLQRLAAVGEIRPVSARALFFLVAHGAEAPYTLTALSAWFDPVDGPLDELDHAEAMTDFVMRGLRP